MEVKLFAILFFMLNQIIPIFLSQNSTQAGQSFVAIELFDERLYNYSRRRECGRMNCRNAVLNNWCEAQNLFKTDSCQVLDCEDITEVLGCRTRDDSHFLAVAWTGGETSHRPLYQNNVAVCDDGHHFINIPCRCSCIKEKWRVHLGESTSNINDNYVIVNVRFQTKNNVIYLQAAQGKLEANGTISDVSWIPLPENPKNLHIMNLLWRSLYLDDVRLPTSHVVTGVKFEALQTTNSQKISGFAITISGVPLNSRTGKLDLGPRQKKVIRINLNLQRRSVPIYRRHNSDNVLSDFHERSSNEYNNVLFQKSDLHYDFGQSTVPLVHVGTRRILQYSPLSGMRMLHYSTKNAAGFVTTELFSINALLQIFT